jgi:hypothetical protein
MQMKIGLFTPNYPGITGEGGIGTYARSLFHALCEIGHEKSATERFASIRIGVSGNLEI